MLVGYCRISTDDQSLALQEDALLKLGCSKIFSDVASGALDSRKGLQDALAFARPGDSLCVWKLDRLGRSLKHLVETINHLNAQGIEFRSVQESIDTKSPGGKLLFHIMGALAEFEREIISDRTRAGLAAARARGRVGGRPSKLGDEQIQMARSVLADGKTGVSDVARMLRVSRGTLYRHLQLNIQS